MPSLCTNSVSGPGNLTRMEPTFPWCVLQLLTEVPAVSSQGPLLPHFHFPASVPHLSGEQPGGQCGHPQGEMLSGLGDLHSPMRPGHSTPPMEAFPALGRVCTT